MASWLPFALMAVVGYLGFNTSLKIGGMALHPIIFSTLLYLSAIVFQLTAFGVFYILKRPVELIPVTGYLIPVCAAVIAGLSVVVIDISMTYMVSRGGSMSLGFPLVYVCQLALTAAVGLLFFREQISLVNVGGIFVGLVAVAMILYRPI